MLSLGEQDKKVMRKSGALICDAAGKDVLRGLTLAESIFVLDLESGARDATGVGEVAMYNQLLSLHLAAKLLHQAAQARPK